MEGRPGQNLTSDCGKAPGLQLRRSAGGRRCGAAPAMSAGGLGNVTTGTWTPPWLWPTRGSLRPPAQPGSKVLSCEKARAGEGLPK